MKRIICTLILCLTFAAQADLKDVFTKIPHKFDVVMKLDLQKLLKVKKISEKIVDNDQYKKMQKTLQEKLNLTDKDILSVYMCLNTKQYYNINFQDLEKTLFDSLIIVELAKELEFDKVKAELPEQFTKIKVINGINCIAIENKQMRNPHAAFITPKMIMISPDYGLKDLLALKPENSILKNAKIVEMLKENGFGGIVSMVHAGTLQKVPAMTPWLSDYRGAALNMYYDESKGLDVELSTNYKTIESVKSASIMVGMGLGFLDMKPELKEFKELIKFRVLENNLYIDFKVSPTMIKKMEDMANARIEAVQERMRTYPERKAKRELEKKSQAEEVQEEQQ